MIEFSKFSLRRQFMLMSFLILLIGMLVIGSFLNNRITANVLNETAAVTALFVNSIISPQLQNLVTEENIDAFHLLELDRLLMDSSLKDQIVSFKVWSTDGRIIYSPYADLIGNKYQIDHDLETALSGQVISELSSLDKPEHEYESQKWDYLIETYAPIRADSDGKVIAVAEFYQLPDRLDAQLKNAQIQSWLVVGISTFFMYLLLTGIVRKASNTIQDQQEELNQKIIQLTELLSQNTKLNNRVRKAAERTTELNEQFLRRISADFHDGPIQDLALSLLRIEEVSELCQECPTQNTEGQLISQDLKLTQSTLESSLKEFRSIISGLRLPELERLTLKNVVDRAILNYRRKTKRNVSLTIDNLPKQVPLPVKIAIYRVLQEALLNGFHHASTDNQSVRLLYNNDEIQLEVIDDGVGFDPIAINKENHLGISGMRERIEILGGSFTIISAPEEGTCIKAVIPLEYSY